MKFKLGTMGCLAVLILVSIVAPAKAQIITQDDEPFGFSVPTEVEPWLVEESKTMADSLKLPPLNPREVCHLWERYAASYVLDRRIAAAPQLATSLGISSTDVKTWRFASSQALAKKLSNILYYRDDKPPFPRCQFWISLDDRLSIFAYDLSLEDRWDVARVLLRSLKEHTFADPEVLTKKQIMLKVDDYIRGEGRKKYKQAWLDSESYTAGITLKSWLLDFGYAPSALGLDATQTAKLLEEFGRK